MVDDVTRSPYVVRGTDGSEWEIEGYTPPAAPAAPSAPKPYTVTEEQTGETWEIEGYTPPAPREPSAIERGWITGIAEQNPRMFGSAMDAFGRKAGSQSLIDAGAAVRGLERYRPEEYKMRAGSILDVRSLDELATYAGEALGQGAASMAPTFGAGFLGGTAGAAGGGALAGPPGAIAGGVAGAAAGAGSVSYVMAVGEIHDALQEAGVDPDRSADVSLYAAVPFAALDSIPVTMFANRLLGQSAKREVARSIARRVAAEAAKGVPAEGLTEVAQEMIKQATVAMETDGRFLTEENVKAWADSFAGGGLVGGTMGGITAIRPDRVQQTGPRFTVDDPGGPLNGKIVTQSPSQAGARPNMVVVVTEDGQTYQVGQRLLTPAAAPVTPPAAQTPPPPAPVTPASPPVTPPAAAQPPAAAPPPVSPALQATPPGIPSPASAPPTPVTALPAQQAGATAPVVVAPRVPAAPPVVLSENDQASPIPSQDIADGKAIIEQALSGTLPVTPRPLKEGGEPPEAQAAATMQPAPGAGARVRVTIGGKVETGTLEEEYQVDIPEGGGTEPGVRVRLDSGRVIDEPRATLDDMGVTIEPEEANAPVPVPASPAPGGAPLAAPGTDVGAAGGTAPAAAEGAGPAPVEAMGPPVKAPDAATLEAAANEAATSSTNALPEPTDAQKEAGNYKVGRTRIAGLEISIENPKGSIRSKTNAETGEAWSVKMPAHYGRILRTKGADGDHVDVYIGDQPDSPSVFIVDQVDPDTGAFDEHKTILGTRSIEEARALYDAGFSDGRGAERRGNITFLTMQGFKDWLANGDTSKPFRPIRGRAGEDMQAAPADPRIPLVDSGTTGGQPENRTETPAPPAAAETIVQSNGKPWSKKGPAILAANSRSKREGVDYEPVQVEGGWGIQKTANQRAAERPDGAEKEYPARTDEENDADWTRGQAAWTEDLTVFGRRELATKAGIRPERANVVWTALTLEEQLALGRAVEATPSDDAWRAERSPPDVSPGPGEEWRVARRKGDSAKDVWGYYPTEDDAKRSAANANAEDEKRARRERKPAPAPADDRLARLNAAFDAGQDDADAAEARAPEAPRKPRLEESPEAFARRYIEDRGAAVNLGSAMIDAGYTADDVASVDAGALEREIVTPEGVLARNEAARKEPMPRRWDYTLDQLREAIADDGMAPAWQDVATLRAWSGSLSEADYRRLEKIGIYDFPRIMATTMEPGRMLEAFQRSLKADKAVYIEDGEYRETLDRTRAELLGETPAAAPAPAPAADPASEALMRAAEALTKAAEKLSPVTSPEPAPQKAPKSTPEKAPKPETPPRTKGEVAKSAAKNTVQGADQAMSALTALFNPKGKLGSGPTFDEETWEAAKPLFIQAASKFRAAAADIAELTRMMVKDMRENFGLTREGMEAMRPYVLRFAAEVDDGIITLQEPDTDGTVPDNLGEDGERQDRPDVPEGEPDGARGAGDVGAQPPADAGATAQGRRRGGSGARSGASRGRGAVRGDRGGATADGRPGGSGSGVADAGTGGRAGDDSAPAAEPTRPNYHVSDPEQLIGGTPKVRFARNRAAIEAFRSITEEARDPRPEELDAMAGYIGWGSFGQELFQGTWERPRPKDGWQAEDEWLRGYLGKEEWESAQASIINAHYTDPPTVMAMWDMVRAMGFKGGRVLEPSMGIGNFFGMMPRDLMAASQLTGIEMDKLTGGMAKLLYPQANVQIKPYQDSRTPDGFYDLVIGNWPFSEIGPADRRYAKLSPTLHDFFFLKALDQTRPGGIVIGITSAGTMDKLGQATRRALDARASLVASFRLPSGAFEKYAGTAVVTDLIVLRRKTDLEQPRTLDQIRDQGSGFLSPPFIETVKKAVPSEFGGMSEINLNEYYAANPDNVLGTLAFGSGSTYGRPSMIVRRPGDLMERLRALPSRVNPEAYKPIVRGKEPRFETNNTADRQRSIVEQKGKLFIVEGERLLRLDDVTNWKLKDKKRTAEREDQFKRLIGLRKAYGALIDAERRGDANVEGLRATMREAYEGFRAKHGPIKDSDAIRIFARLNEPSTDQLRALERPDGSPALILTAPTTRAPRRLEKPTVRDAFVMVRNERAVLDLDRVAELAGRPVEEVTRELVDAKAVYRTPGGGHEVTDVYLSGNVRRKLREAMEAAEAGEDMAASIEALREVLPKDIPYFNIEAKLGASWVQDRFYVDFVADLLGGGLKDGDLEMRFTGGSWKVALTREQRMKPEATAQWGVDFYRFDKLVQAAMNNETIRITTKDDDGNDVYDEKASAEVNEKARLIRERFQAWIWTDAERRVQAEKDYNEIMNAIATPRYDGAFLDFPGMALRRGEDPFSLRKHQVDAIWRGLANGRGLYAHEVGTGKTYTMGGIAVESRRYGLARKPLIIAHNANSATVAREIGEMYPGARLLYVDNLSPQTIGPTLYRIANDDWDAVVIPHSLIDRMALREETLMELAAEEIAALEEEAMLAADEDGASLTPEMMDDEDAMKKVRSVTAKQLVKQRSRIIENIKKQGQRASRENAVAFEDLGIDMVIVDEAHEFKKPAIATRMTMKGLNKEASSKSLTLSFLTGYVKRMNGGRGVHTFSGTFITNTLTEIFHQMRYVMDSDMAEAGVKDWDHWFNTFADASSDVELTATGEYESVTRLASFVNVAELRRMAGQYMDIVFADDMPEFRPRTTASGKTLADDLSDAERKELLEGRAADPQGRPYKRVVNDIAPMGERQAAALAELRGRAATFKAMEPKQRREASLMGSEIVPIRVETDAANASLDVRLFDMDAPDEPQSKVNRAVRNILEVYRSDGEATQVVFMERGFSDSSMKTVGRDGDGKPIREKVARFNLATDLVDKLVAAGVPREEIAIVDGGVSKEKRKEIADKMNRSEVRVVIGNTATLGVGVNMQRQLRAMHHLDAPWTPGELEQRNGRGQRQGNLWNTVLEIRYITEKLDGRRWQVLLVKDRFIKAFMHADEGLRVIDGDAVEDEGTAGDITETLSAASGDPRILLVNKLKADIDKIERRERLHVQGVADARARARSIEREEAPRLEDRAAILATDADAFDKAREAGFSATIDGKTYTERKEVIPLAEAWQAAFEARVRKLAKGDDPLEPEVFGTIQGFKVEAWSRKSFLGDTPWFPDFTMTGPANRDYDISTVTPAAVEGKARGIRGASEESAKEAADLRASAARLRAAAEEPFQSADALEKKRKALADLEQDLQNNPSPPPEWLRQGAPVGTEVFVAGEAGMERRVVEAHQWSPENYLVITDQGPIGYLEAKQADGTPIYEERAFEPPVTAGATADKAPVRPQDEQRDAADEDADDDTLMQRVAFSSPLPPRAVPLARAVQEVVREIAGTEAKIEPRIMAAEFGPAAPDEDIAGAYTIGKDALRIALYFDQKWVSVDDMIETGAHEAFHRLQLRFFTDRELAVLREASDAMAAYIEDQAGVDLRHQPYFERAAYAFQIYYGIKAGLREPGGPQTRLPLKVRLLWDKIVRALRRIQNLARGRGFRTWEDLFEQAASGRVAARGERPVNVGEAERMRAASLPQRQRIPRKPAPKVEFADPATEKRFKEAQKGIASVETFRQKVTDYLAHMKHGFTRRYIALPNTERFADLKEQLRKLDAAPVAGRERVIRYLRELTDGMNRDDLDLFTRKVILDDLVWEDSLGHALPFGFTSQTLMDAVKDVNAAIATRPDLVAKVRLRKAYNKRVARAMVDAGIFTEQQIKNPSYYRHQVLEYARMREERQRGTAGRLRSPRWAKREGSTLDINANLLEAEFEWLARAFTNLAEAETIEWIDRSPHNVRRRAIGDAKARNKKLMADAIAADMAANGFMKNGVLTSPMNEQDKAFRQRIAMGFKFVADAINAGNLVIPSHFTDAANALAAGVGDENAFAFLSWLLDGNKPGAKGAAVILKAISQRKKWMQDTLGDAYTDPQDIELVTKRFAPEGYVTWQPEEGKLMFMVKTIAERSVDNMIGALAQATASQKLVTPEVIEAALRTVKPMLAVGGDKYKMILPQEVADTLNKLRDDPDEQAINRVFRVTVQNWKRWILLNPRSVLRYNLNNLSGDIDATIAGNPRALRKMPQAIKELYQVMLRKQPPSARYQEAVARGVMDSGISIQEIPDIGLMSEFERLINPPTVREPGRFMLSGLRRVWNATSGLTQFRENWLRYAAYLDYVERIEKGEAIEEIGFGASHPDIVRAVTDPKDRAALLARQLIGDYSDISEQGRWLRSHLIPFYSWFEVNWRRYWRLTANAFNEGGIGKGLATGGALGAVMGARGTVWLLFRMAAVYALVSAWNNLMFPDEEEDLDELDRLRLHINLGRDDEGRVVTLKFQGAFSDFISWFGMPDVAVVAGAVEEGKADLTDILATIAKAPINKVANSITPLISTPVELVSGQSYWPDIFNPRQIRDGWREAFSTFNLQNEYDLVMGKPSRGYGESWWGSLVNRYDTAEVAYDKARGWGYDWLEREKGQSGGVAATTERSTALYDWRRAQKFGDTAAEARAWERLMELGVNARSLRQSIARAHPLGMIAKKDRQAYLATLNDREKETLQEAIEWYLDTYRPGPPDAAAGEEDDPG